MSGTSLFLILLVTALMCISAAKEIARRNFTMGATLLAIPACGWFAIWWTAS